MTSEAGDMRVLGNFRRLIQIVSADPNYQPSNTALTRTGLEALDATASAAVENLANKSAPHKTAVRERIEAFEPLPTRGRQVRNVARASGASKTALANLETPLRKFSGKRASARIKDDPNTPEDESAGQRSASQMSFDNRTGNFRTFVSLVKELTSYSPHEPDLKVSALEAYGVELEARNTAVITTSVPLAQARALRDQLLYLNPDSVVNIARLVKAYVKGAIGASSPLYKQIKGLEFKKR